VASIALSIPKERAPCEATWQKSCTTLPRPRVRSDKLWTDTTSSTGSLATGASACGWSESDAGPVQAPFHCIAKTIGNFLLRPPPKLPLGAENAVISWRRVSVLPHRTRIAPHGPPRAWTAATSGVPAAFYTVNAELTYTMTKHHIAADATDSLAGLVRRLVRLHRRICRLRP
jgi:hypothetical protein